MLKGMTRSGLALALVLTFSLAGFATAARAQGQQKKPAYSYAEYNAYQAAAKETNPQQRIKLLDDFVSKFPKSTLLPYVYQAYYKTYDQLKKYDKVIEYADKLVESKAKEVDNGMRLQALYTREVAFNYAFDGKAPDAQQQAQKARQYAEQGQKLLGELAKPKGMSDAQFAAQKKTPAYLFSYTEGFCALFLKDYAGAEKAFIAALSNDPKNAVAYFRLGLAYLQQAAQVAASAPQTTPTQTPPAGTTGAAQTGAGATAGTQPAPLPGPSAGQELYIKGFWALARSIALKGPNEQQVRSYLKNQMLVYQKTACQDLLTQQMNQLLQMAQTTTTVNPPADYTLPSGVQLGNYLQNTNLFTIMQDLQGDGNRAKFVWLAVCGNEFPEVPVKVISVSSTTDGVDMQVYTGQNSKDLQAAKTANMEVKVVNQPAAQRLKKDDIVRFTGTLASYDPPPNFLLHWDNAKVKPADIPPAKPGARKRGHTARRQRR
jgi:tetratricopeptide (TPR) repeat protein